MSESRSASKRYDSFNQNVIKKPSCDLFEDDHLQNNPDYIQRSSIRFLSELYKEI